MADSNQQLIHLDRDWETVALVKADTSTRWWIGVAKDVEVIFITGRVKFKLGGKSNVPAPFPSALLYFGGLGVGYVEYRELVE